MTNVDLQLHLAIFSDNYDLVKYLVDEQNFDVNARDNKGRTPLHLAVPRRNIPIIRRLIEKGANINAQDENGWTPLHYTINVDTVKFLIDQGADYAITDFIEEGTPVFYAFQGGYLQLVKYFVEEKGIDPMMRVNENGGTLLGEACAYENLNVIRYAIDEKNAVYDGNELLDVAVSHGHLDIVKYLVEEKGVDVNFIDENGWSLLLHGTEQWRTEVVEYLLEKGADTNSAIEDGTTALHIAAGQHNCEIIEYLIMKGADINVRDNYGNIPLHLAAQDDIFQNQEDKIDVMKYLIRRGADINAKNNDGKTAANVATDSNVIEYLNSL